MQNPSLDEMVIDTSPPGADPDELVSFDAGAEDFRDETGDPHRFSDEPFDEFDPEAVEEPDDESVSFGNVTLEDDSTYELWLQSCLKALVEPTLAVDGKLGTRTRAAIKKFQHCSTTFVPDSSPLDADGIAGPKTIAALEAATGTRAPTSGEDDREEAHPEEPDPNDTSAAPADATVPTDASQSVTGVVDGSDDPPLVVREQVVDGKTEYVISAGGDPVMFSYWTPDWNNYKPYNVSRYKGAKRDLIGKAEIIAAGYSESEFRIYEANAAKESRGAFGAINTWDDQIVSWGMAQFAGHAGTLAVLLAELKENPRSARSFARWFVRNGIDVAYGKYPYKNRTGTGWHVVVRGDDGVHIGDDGWRYIRTQPRQIGAFLLAGNDPAIALGQVLYWRRSFLSRAIRKVIGKTSSSKGAPVHRFLTAERSLALIVRLNNWMPINVVKWCDDFLPELAKKHPDRDVYDPDAWNQPLEDDMAAMISARRKTDKKPPGTGYDTYALGLSRDRGSFKIGKE